MEPEIRFALPGERRELERLESDARTALVGVRGGDRWLEDHPMMDAAWDEAIDRGDVLVAVIDEVIVGFLLLSVVHERAVVEGVYVEPEAREVGCGDGLLEQALVTMRDRGGLVVDAEALPGDRETKNLYERAGIKARLITVSAPL